MQMTKSRKVVAMLLAVLMAFSSMSVFASALNYNDDGDIIFESTDGQQSTDGSNLQSTIDVKFYDAEGNEIADLGTVTPGQTIQARVFVGTNYYTSTSDLMFYYDPDFMDVNYPEVTIGDQTVKHGVVAVNTAAIQPATGKTATVTAELNAVATTADEGSFTVALMAEADSATFVLDPTVYLFAIDMVVKANASADDDGIGAVYAKTSDFATEANMGGYTNIPYGTADDNQYEAAPSYFFNGALTVTNTSVTINNKATFYNDTDDTTGTIVEGKVGNEYTVPTAAKEGYTFKGWASASGLTIAADATTFTMPAEANVEYTAIWNQDVAVTVDPNGGKFADNTTEAKTYTAEQGTAWADKPAEPTYDGYKFMGWEIDGAVVDALPDNYPVVDGDKIAYTYTAQWEKLVKITIDPNGGTFADNTTAAKEYQDTDPATAVIVGGQAWNTSAVPTYDIPAYTYAATGISNTGYALMGWRTSDGTTIQSFPTTFPEDDETYTAVWQAMDVRVYYFADATAATAADVNTDTSNTNASRVNYVSVPYGTQYTVLSYTNDGESVATWTTPDGATYAPGSTLNLTAPTVTFGTNGIPNKIILIASNAQFTGDDKYEASFVTNGGTWADTNTTDTRVALYSDGETITAPADITKAGYTFKGWTPGLGTMTTAGAEFEAIWEVKTYEVTFVSEGAEYEKLTFTVENEVEFPADPEKEGNTFIGWYKDVACTDGNEFEDWSDLGDTEAVTVYAKFDVNQYTISFEENGGTEVADITADFGAAVAAPTAPTKTGYTFKGWYEAENFSGEAYAFTTMPAKDVTLYAKFDIDQYTIKFNSDGGSAVADITQDYGTDVAEPTAPTKTGYDFDAWYLDGAEYTFSTMPAENIELTAHWNIHKFDINYYVDGVKDTDRSQTEVEYNSAVTVASAPTKTGYVFSGWALDDGSAVPEVMPDNELNIYGTFTKDNYTITYVTDGTPVEQATVRFEAEIPYATTSKDGATFDKWVYTDADGVEYTGSTMPASNLTATAQWVTETYTIYFDSNGGSAVAEITAAYNADITAPADPTREGYTFTGWTLDGADYSVPTTMPDLGDNNASITAVAKWEKESYTYTFETNGGSAVADIPAEYGAAITVPSDPTKTGFTFGGWYEDADLTQAYTIPSTMPDLGENNAVKTLYAKFTANPHTITYLNEGTLVEKFDVAYGDDIEVTTTEATKTGYTFIKWADADGNEPDDYDSVPDKNLVFNAVFEINHYDVYYYVDGVKDDALTQNYSYNEAIAVAADSTKTGYTFSGWKLADGSAVPTTMPALEPGTALKVYGTFTINEYTITYNAMGGTSVETATVTFNDAIPSATSTKAGYKLDETNPWTYRDDNGIYTGTTMPASNLDATANWVALPQTLEYYVDGVKSTALSTTVDTDAAYTLEATPTKEGYQYSAWKYEDGSLAALTGTMPVGGIKVYTTSTALPQTITYIVDGVADTTITPAAADTDSTFTLGTPTAKTGYDFNGWYTNAACTESYTAAAMPAGGITVYGKFDVHHWTITFDANGGSVTPATMADVAYGTALSQDDMPTPTWTGHSFTSWEALPATMPDNDITVKAVWDTVSYKITYVTTGSAVPEATVAFEAAIPAATSTKAGYHFDGWTYADADGNAYTGTTMPAYNLVATAQFTAEAQALEYYVDGVKDEALSTTVNTDAAYTLEAVPTKDGYSYTAWKLADGTDAATAGTMPAGGIKVYTTSTALDQALEYYVDGVKDEALSTTVKTDAIYTLAAVPTKAGYTYTAWKLADGTDAATTATMTAGGVKVYTTSTADPQAIKYYINGVEDTTLADTKATDAAFTLAAKPVTPGYSYTDWEVKDANGNAYDGTTVPAGGLKIYTVKTADDQAITYIVDGETVALTPATAKTDAAIVLAAKPVKDGYTYTAWAMEDGTEIPATMPAGGITVVSTSTADTQTITYIVDGTVVALEPASAATDAAVTLAQLPTKAGYTYTAWAMADGTDIPATMPAGGIIVVTTSSADDQTITYIVDGEEVVLTPNTAKTDAAIVLAAKPTKAGYTYTAWAMADGSAIPATMPAGGITVVSTSSSDAQAVNYYVDNVKDEERSTAVATDGTITEASKPTKTGYTFYGWYSDAACTTDFDFTQPMPANTVNIYGKFVINAYTVKFVLDNGEEDIDKRDNYGTALSRPADPKKTGYDFVGWDVDGDGDVDAADVVPTTYPAENMTITAIYSIKQYTITFDTDGGTVIEAITQDYNTAVTAPADPTKTGYTFDKWDTTIPTTMPAESITIKALWNVNPYTITYTVGEGETLNGREEVTVNYKEAIPAAPTASKTGYTFKGWTVTGNGSEYTGTTMPAYNLTATPIFEAITYTVTYVSEGTSEAKDFTYPAEIVNATAADKEGYSFAGWYLTADYANEFAGWNDILANADENNAISVYAKYDVNPYTVTFTNPADADYNVEVDSTYGTSINTPTTAPVKEGYHFDKWVTEDGDDLPTTMPAKNFTAVATFAPNQYKAIFMKEAGADYTEWYSMDVDYDAAIVAPTGNPTKTGYNFLGWSRTQGATAAEALGVMDTTSADGIKFYPVYVASAENEILFSGNGGTWNGEATKAVDGQVYDSAIVLPTEEPTMTGYHVIGYAMDADATAESAGFVAKGDALPAYTTATAGQWYYIWAESEYTITYISDGTELATENALYGSLLEDANAPTAEKTGYAFQNWTYADAEGNAYEGTTMPAYNLVATAKFAPRPVKVTYALLLEDGSIYDANYIVENRLYDDVITAKAYNSDEYELIGWYQDIDCTVPFTSMTINTLENITVYAKLKAVDYTVTFKLGADDAKWADGTTADKEVTVAFGEVVEAPVATRTGYTFDVWADALPATMPAENVTVTATWTPITYTITYNFSEAGGSETIDVDYDADIDEPVADREGYELEGWYLDADCTTPLTGWADIAENADTANEITVYAKWTANEVVITFNPNNGEEAYTVTRNYDDKILGTDVEDPAKANYYFMGWVDAEGNKITADDTVTVAAEYTAVYAPGEVKFNYYVDGNIVASVNVPYGTTTQILTYTTADTTVDTWSTADGDLTLTAGQDYTVAPETLAAINLYADTTTETTYTATFKLGADDAVWADGTAADIVVESLKTGDAVTAPEDPTRTGYVFGGWTPAVGTIAGENVEFTAIWNNGDTYTVTYKIIKVSNGQIKGTEDLETVTGVNYGETLDVPADAEIGDSYEFTETWVVGSEAEVTKYLNGEDSTAKAYDSDSISGVVVKGNMTVYAVYNQGAFAVNFYAYGEGTPTTAECNTLVGEEMMIPAGSELTAPEAPEYANFIFVGWFDADGNEVKTGDAVTAPINAYAKYERVTVKLVAKEGNTAMVERDGVVETYNTFAAGDKTPYGATSIITPNSDAYTAADYSAWYVYGLAPNLKVSALADYVKITGDGSYKVYNASGEEVADTAALGTGLVIKVTDNETNTVVEEFYVVIFGDIDGNGVINGNDSGRLSSEVISRNWSTGANTKNYLVKAADLDLNGIINGNDGGKLKTVTLKNAAINQITGYSN